MALVRIAASLGVLIAATAWAYTHGLPDDPVIGLVLLVPFVVAAMGEGEDWDSERRRRSQ